MENNKSKYDLNKRLIDIRVKTLNNYDEIINSMNRFSDEMYIKDLQISQLIDDLCSINEENEKKDVIIQILKEKCPEFSNKFMNIDKYFDRFDDLQNYNELFEGKLLVSEQINQLIGSRNIEAESYRLSDLINILFNLILGKEEELTDSIKHQTDQYQQLMKKQDDYKEWQKHLENENKKLDSAIEGYENIIKMLKGKENDHIILKENHSILQQTYDELYRDNADLKILIEKYKCQLSEKEKKCIDGDILIKTLQLNLTEQANQFEQVNSMYNNEKEKCQKIQSHSQKIIEEFTAQNHVQNINIASIQNECYFLKDQSTDEAEFDSLKQNITMLYNQNKTIQKILKNSNKQTNEQIYKEITKTSIFETYGNLPLMKFVDKTKRRIRVVHIDDDLTLWILFIHDSINSDYDTLFKNMNMPNKSQYYHKMYSVELFDIYAVQVEDEWYRFHTKNFKDDKVVGILIDLGIEWCVSKNEVRFLPQIFLNFPSQAIKCSLTSLNFVPDFREANDLFHKILLNKEFSIIPDNIEGDVPLVTMYNESCNMNSIIMDAIIEKTNKSLELNGMKNISNVNMTHVFDKNNVKYADSRRSQIGISSRNDSSTSAYTIDSSDGHMDQSNLNDCQTPDNCCCVTSHSAIPYIDTSILQKFNSHLKCPILKPFQKIIHLNQKVKEKMNENKSAVEKIHEISVLCKNQ